MPPSPSTQNSPNIQTFNPRSMPTPENVVHIFAGVLASAKIDLSHPIEIELHRLQGWNQGFTIYQSPRPPTSNSDQSHHTCFTRRRRRVGHRNSAAHGRGIFRISRLGLWNLPKIEALENK